MANKGDIYKVALPNGDEYNFKDKYVRENYRALNNNDFDTINVTELNSGNIINTGAARFLNTINGSISGNAATATKATQDSDGSVINTTYLKKSGGTMTGALHVSNTGKLIFDWTSGTDCAMFVLKDAENYGIHYQEGNTDTMKFSASGNAHTNNADLCINGAGDGTVTIRGNTIIHAGNYTSYTVKKDGTGASGTWGININGNADSATSASQLSGFTAKSSQTWGNQTGTFVHGEDDSTGGSIAFRRDNPSNGQMSMIIDGTIYIKEGKQNVGEAVKSFSVNGTTVTYTTLWGNTGTFTTQDTNDQFSLGVNGNSVILKKNGTTQDTITVPYATSATTASNLANFENNNSTGKNANDVTYNAHTYYTSNGPSTSIGASTNDGALYTQAYSTSWVGQIAQDYRNGNLFTRGKNNGTWQAWRKVAYTGDAPTAHNQSADTITSGYLNIQPENSPILIPFMNNDLAYMITRGGSTIVKYDGTTQSIDISGCFDAGPGYGYGISNSGNYTSIVMELTLHQTFTWTNTIYVDFGAAGWRAKDVEIEVMNSNYSGDTWTSKYHNTSNTLGHCYVITSHTPSGASNAGGGFNKIRFTFKSFNNAIFRIAQLGLYNYSSGGLRTTYMSRGIDDAVWRSITPATTNTYNLGSSSLKWKDIYATTFHGALDGNASTATSATTASYANFINLIASNEIRFGNKPSSAVDVYFNYQWADGTASAMINKYVFMNGNKTKCPVEASKFIGALQGNADTATSATSATKATQDSDGNAISSTYVKVTGDPTIFKASDIAEGAANLSTQATAHRITVYRNGMTIPYQMDNANDGGMIRVRGTSESNCIFELGTWDDSGTGETIQFNYYPTTSQVTPTYSVTVPKATGTLSLTNQTISNITRSGTTFTATRADGTTFTFDQKDDDTKYGISASADNITLTAGGTGTTVSLNTLINGLSTGNSTPVDADYYISQYVNGGTSTTTYHRRPMSALWSYIKGKGDSTYAAKTHTHPVSDLTWAGGVNLTTTASANNQEWSIDLTPGSYTGTYFHIWSAKNSKSILACYPDNNSVTIPNGTLTVANNITTTGHLIISDKSGSYSWNEGIRINRAGNGYCSLVMGGVADSTSGTGDGIWWIGCNMPSLGRRLYFAHNGSTQSSTYFYADSSSQQSPNLRIGGTLGVGNARATKTCQMKYNENTDSLDFVFVA